MENLIEYIGIAYKSNEDNFQRELRQIFYDNEYIKNERTIVKVRGYFDLDECRPYIQFIIKTDHEELATEFYRHDFSVTNQKKKDEFDVFDLNAKIVTGLLLYEKDLV